MNSDLHIPAIALSLLVLLSCAGRAALPTADISVGGHTLTVEIADDEEERATGLMNRKNLDTDRGMLFVFEQERMVSFWMKNTTLPLSIAFITSDGVIRQIEDMEPESLDSVPSHRSVIYALEVNRGWFDERGITPGDRVELPADIR